RPPRPPVFPSPTLFRSHGALRVGAAVGTGHGTDERVAALVEAGVDVIVVDTSHGWSRGVIERVKRIKAEYPDLQVIAGNVVTGRSEEHTSELQSREKLV